MRFIKLLVGLDMFQKTINFTIDGKKTYKTGIGALASFLIILISSLYGLTLLLQIINKTKTQTTVGIKVITNEMLKNRELDLKLNDENVYIAVSWTHATKGDMIEKGYGVLAMAITQTKLVRGKGISDNITISFDGIQK